MGSIEHWVCAALAFVFAAVVIIIDCYQAIRKTSWRVPQQFWYSGLLVALVCGCGLIAAGAFTYASSASLSSSGQASGWLDTVLGSRIDNPYLRAIYTGVAALAIIRSKIVQLKDADFGFEYIYSEVRLRCLSKIRVDWIFWRNEFINRNLDKALKVNDFQDSALDAVDIAVKDADDQYKTSVTSQTKQLRDSKPKSDFDPKNADWRLFYKTIMNLVLENCGTAPLTRFGMA
jgi:hypothetical protein